MKLALGIIPAAVLVGCSSNVPQPRSNESTFDVASRAKQCHAQEAMGSIQCDYKIGNDLKIAIAAVGEESAGISFERSDFDGDFYGSVGVAHGCIVVTPGRKSNFEMGYAFISPKNGKVYRTWWDCKSAT